MSKIYLILYLFIIVIIFIILYIIKKNKKNKLNLHCSKLPKLLQRVLNEQFDKNNFNYYIPCGYNKCEKEIKGIKNIKTGQKIFIIDGCDNVVSKVRLWNSLKKEYGKETNKIMPQTFILNNKKDLIEFKKFYKLQTKNNTCKFILKNKKQRQLGLKLTSKYKDIIQAKNQGFMLVQYFLPNPFLIAGRKINLRYYLLLVCKNGQVSGYIHDRGFVYYTPKTFLPNNIEFERNITTGYIDRKIYKNNPLTLNDFKQFIGKESKNWNQEIHLLFGKIMKVLTKKVCNINKLKNTIRFQLFGVDIAPSNKLKPQIMEINKGPDMGAKDERDKNEKFIVLKDIFNLIEQEDNSNTGFEKIL